jgi:DNA-binding transcriptional MerR regulator
VPRRAGVSVREQGTYSTLEEMLETTGASAGLVKELEDYGLISGQQRQGGGGTRLYDDTDREIVRACAELARYGVAGRNLRVFKTSADRESSLLQQIMAPSLRSRNPERKREAVDALENLAAVASHLKHLLLVRDLRRIAK